MKKHHILLAALVAVAFFVGYGALASAWPINGRDQFRGYFQNLYDTSGNDVWLPNTGPSGCQGTGYAIPTGVNTKSDFINFVKCKLNNGNAQERVGARFIIQTMRGGSDHSAPSSADITDWENRINNPAVSVVWDATRSYTVNSFYQGCCGGGGDPTDDAYYPESGSSTQVITFRYDGEPVYFLRRQCANPISNGESPGLPPAPPPLNFDIDGTTLVNGASSAQVLPGDTVDFQHTLRNAGPTGTSPTTINWSTPTVGPVSGTSGNAGTFTAGQSKTISSARQTFTVPANASPGTQYCSRISFNPNTEGGGSSQSVLRCATVQYSFDLDPRINVVIRDVDGQDVSADGVAEAGYTVQFTYSVRNSGITESQSATCTYRRATHSGYSTAAPTEIFTPSGANCPPNRVFPRSSTTVTATETLSGASVATNTTICRSFTVSPATQSGGSATVQSCVPVVAKPYARVYGGDVSVGNGLTTAPGVCTPNNSASVVGWNRRSAGGYAGAGVQYAALALDAIQDFSTSLGNSGGAPEPQGLAFANTATNVTSGLFGGSFGSVPCIPDYYANRPASAPSASSSLSSMVTGTYTYNGTLSLSGNVNPGQQIIVYVDGDVRITGDIVYPGSWDARNVPLLQLVVRGNIFIDNDVTRLDGVFIAQANGATGGVIHTCSLTAAPLALDGSLFNTCNRKLTINGAFVANQVRLLRTSGTLAQSNVGDGAPGGGAAGEVFNFNPTLWLRQPPVPGGEASDYDAIISLPPIL